MAANRWPDLGYSNFRLRRPIEHWHSLGVHASGRPSTGWWRSEMAFWVLKCILHGSDGLKDTCTIQSVVFASVTQIHYDTATLMSPVIQIGRASCRERV